MKLRILGLITLLLTVFTSFGQDLTYDKVRTKLTVFRNGDLQVDEVYEVTFHEPMHGIYITRTANNKIPLTPKKHVLGKIENLVFPHEYNKKLSFKVNSSSEEYVIEEEGGRWKVKFGNENTYVEGEKQYALSYTIKNALVKGDSTLMVYWNLIGSDHEVEYRVVETEIVLADGLMKDFLDVEFYKGINASTDKVKFARTDEGFILDPVSLTSDKALTMMMHLKASAVAGVETGNPTKRYFWVLIPIVMGLFYFTRKKKYGQQAKLTEMVQYYPPKNVDSALAGVIANKLKYVDALSSLLTYWGWKGFVRLEEKNVSVPKKPIAVVKWVGIAFFASLLLFAFSGWIKEIELVIFLSCIIAGLASFVLLLVNYARKPVSNLSVIKLKELENPADYEKRLFDLLFLKGDEFSFSYLRQKPGMLDIASKEELRQFGVEFTKITDLLFKESEARALNKESQRRAQAMMALYIFLGIAGAMVGFICFGVLPGLLTLGTAILFTVGSSKFTLNSVEGNELIRDTLGFRHFIEVSQKDKLAFLVKENPNYFSETLSYAVAFGLSKEWGEKLQDLTPMPEWYGVPPGVVPTAAMVGHSLSAVSHTQQVAFQTKGGTTGGGFTGGSAGGGVGGGGSGGW